MGGKYWKIAMDLWKNGFEHVWTIDMIFFHDGWNLKLTWLGWGSRWANVYASKKTIPNNGATTGRSRLVELTFHDPSGVKISPRAANMGIFSCSMWGGISGRSELNVNEMQTRRCLIVCFWRFQRLQVLFMVKKKPSERLLAMGKHLQIQRLQRFSQGSAQICPIPDDFSKSARRFRDDFTPVILSLAITQNFCCLDLKPSWAIHNFGLIFFPQW